MKVFNKENKYVFSYNKYKKDCRLCKRKVIKGRKKNNGRFVEVKGFLSASIVGEIYPYGEVFIEWCKCIGRVK